MKRILLKIYYYLLNIKDKITIFYNRNITEKKRPPIVKATDETLDKIINDKCSVSRFGDGEFSLIYGENLKFQQSNEEISSRLKEILKSNSNKHIVCIPNVFGKIDWATDTAKIYWIKYLNLNRNKIYKILYKDKCYYDTQVTRLYIDLKDKVLVKNRFEKIKLLWKNREIVIVEGEKSRLGIGNDLFDSAKSIERIICPSINAYSKYNDILDAVLKQDKEKLILIALGPTATILAYDLSKEGYQAVDIGHIDIEYEWFLNGAKQKCPVKNKYIGEINGGDIVQNIDDTQYFEQIIKKII